MRRATSQLHEQYEVLIHDHQKQLPVEPELIKRAALLTLAFEKAAPCSLAVVLFDDVQMRRLHQTYLRLDEPTDVLAFNLDEDYPDEDGRLDGLDRGSDEKSPPLLGDVFVDVEQAQRQSLDYDHGVKRELVILVSHGVLHLLGYTDDIERGRDEMLTKCELVAEHDWLTSLLSRTD